MDIEYPYSHPIFLVPGLVVVCSCLQSVKDICNTAVVDSRQWSLPPATQFINQLTMSEVQQPTDALLMWGLVWSPATYKECQQVL